MKRKDDCNGRTTYASKRTCHNPDCKSIPGFKLKKCEQCESACYCCAECQQEHWPLHQRHCKPDKRSKGEHMTT